MLTKRERLLLNGKYAEALQAFLKEDANDRNDDTRIGATLGAAQTLMCMGRYKEAEDRVRRDMAVATWTMADHPTHIGLSYWYRSEYKSAVACFREALRSQYQSSAGFGAHFSLYFAAVQRPEFISIAEVEELIAKKLAHWPPPVPSAPMYTAKFLLRQIDEVEYLSHATDGSGKYARALEQYYRCMAHFYVGISRLRDGDRNDFEQCMHKVSASKVNEILVEIIMARLELLKVGSQSIQ